jgi:hypothetical protein
VGTPIDVGDEGESSGGTTGARAPHGGHIKTYLLADAGMVRDDLPDRLTRVGSADLALLRGVDEDSALSALKDARCEPLLGLGGDRDHDECETGRKADAYYSQSEE